ncbi:MAG: DUF4405 domain-containing protein [Deltaproteobacteria bacterium]|nr:DUF4405 domain-containing protein [Deltaproteobacteria bacterium]
MNKKVFNKRAFISVLTFAGFLIMGITGIILFITPAGRIAYWTNWTFAGLTKTQWGNIHIVSSLLFLIAGILHTWMNWKPLMGYIRNKVKRGIRFSWELGITLCILLFIIVGAVLEIPPFGSFLGFNEFVKESWIASESHEPPFGHAEMLSLKGFAKKMDIDPKGAVEALQSKGVRIVSVDDSLEKIAHENKTSPMELYLMIRHLEKPDMAPGSQVYTAEMIEEKFAGSGIGQKTLGQVCE